MLICHVNLGFVFSPEVMKSEPYSDKADIWAVGCVVYQMVVQEPPFSHQNNFILMQKVSHRQSVTCLTSYFDMKSRSPAAVEDCNRARRKSYLSENQPYDLCYFTSEVLFAKGLYLTHAFLLMWNEGQAGECPWW